jgi:hypothetical protein
LTHAQHASVHKTETKGSGGKATGGNGGHAQGGNADCSTSGGLIGINALNVNSCNGGNADASGGNANSHGTYSSLDGVANILGRDVVEG